MIKEAFAVVEEVTLGTNQPGGVSTNTTVGNIISNFLLIMYIVGGLAVLVFLIWGAFDWITSGGDKEKVSGARRKIMNAFIGLALLALAAFIVTIVGQVVGINLFGNTVIPRLGDPPAGTAPGP